MQIQVIERRDGIVFDRELFAKWLCYSTDVTEACASQAATGCEACLELNVLLRLHLNSALEKTSEGAAVELDESEDDAAECGTDNARLLKAWRHVRGAVKKADAAEEEEKQEQQEVATACASSAARPSRHITDASLARWMRTVIDWRGADDFLEVLRDEVSAAAEMEAFGEPIESSGTWGPDQVTHRNTEEELMG